MNTITLAFSAIHPNITSEHLERLTFIDVSDFNRYFEKAVELGLISREADRDAMIFSLKQYYAIAMLDPANGHAVSDVLDPLWHAHMLFSEEYHQFCVEVVGEFMHHTPLPKEDGAMRTKVRSLYDYTLVRLRECFSHVDERMWPTLPDDRLICMHKGNQAMYAGMQSIRLFEPNLALAT
ncbi:MAG TPA: hypothetical protein VFV22_02405 [Candidatus Paceibacterota bacterium]|nr:hypothetical protein [Candidatus Paceibacterota bacterium]